MYYNVLTTALGQLKVVGCAVYSSCVVLGGLSQRPQPTWVTIVFVCRSSLHASSQYAVEVLPSSPIAAHAWRAKISNSKQPRMSRGYPQPYPFANGSNRTYGTYNQGSDRYDAGYRRPSEQESDTAGRERRAAEYGMHGGGNGSMPQQTSYQLGSRGSEPELGQDSYRRPDRPDRAWSSQGRSTDIARHDDSDMGFEPQERSKQIEGQQ